MARGKIIYEGAFVTIRIPPYNQMPDGMKRYDNTIHRVSRVRDYGAWGKTYELEDVVGRNGVPYTWTKDELRLAEVCK